ncbi:MAG: hypothetical protein EA398_00840 [Deltaproteobacteria bacterium]|nr:MAG: hypothetical protein EA398_00840 [Deltaproteobacteria bacterium]
MWRRRSGTGAWTVQAPGRVPRNSPPRSSDPGRTANDCQYARALICARPPKASAQVGSSTGVSVMRIECPACGAGGRYPGENLPPEGKTIRCPKCGTKFRIGGPPADGVATEGLASSLGTTGPGTEADEGRQELEDAASPDVAATAPVEPEREGGDAEGASEEGGEDADSHDALFETSDSDEAGLDGAEAVDEPGSDDEPPAKAYAARLSGTIRYDFPSGELLANWLRARESFDDLEVTDDGGLHWHTVDGLEEFAAIEPGGARRRPVRPADETPPPEESTGEDSGQSGSPDPAGPAPNPKPGAGKPKKGTARGAKDEGAGPGRRRLVALAMTLGVVLAVGAWAFLSDSGTTVRIPSTPAGQQASWLVAQFNAPGTSVSESELRERFCAPTLEHVTVSGLQGNLQRNATHMTDVRPLQILDNAGPHRIAVRVEHSGGQEMDLEVVVDADAPHCIVSMQLQRTRDRR